MPQEINSIHHVYKLTHWRTNVQKSHSMPLKNRRYNGTHELPSETVTLGKKCPLSASGNQFNTEHWKDAPAKCVFLTVVRHLRAPHSACGLMANSHCTWPRKPSYGERENILFSSLFLAFSHVTLVSRLSESLIFKLLIWTPSHSIL